MDTDHETDSELFPTDDAVADDEAIAAADGTAKKQDETAKKTAAASRRAHSRPDFGCLAGAAVLLAIILFFGWVIIGAIVEVEKDKQAAKRRYREALYPSHSYSSQRSSGGSKSGSASSGSSSGGYTPKKSGGSSRDDEYNAADFGNAEDFYDEHYDDFFDYYDAEDYWNEHN